MIEKTKKHLIDQISCNKNGEQSVSLWAWDAQELLDRITELEKVAEAAGVIVRGEVCSGSGYTDFYQALREAGYLKEQG